METNVGIFDADRPNSCFCAKKFSKKHPPYVMVNNGGSPSCCGYVAAPKCFRGAWTAQQERWINDTRYISVDNIVVRDAADRYRCLGCNTLTEITFYDQRRLPTVMPLSPLVFGLKNMIKESKKICAEWEKMDWGSPLDYLLRVTFDPAASPEPTTLEMNFTLFYYTSKSEGKRENVKNVQSWIKLISTCLTKKNLTDPSRWDDDCFCGKLLSNSHPPSNLPTCWAHRVARESFCRWWCAEFSNDYRGPPPPIIVELIQEYLYFRSKSEIEHKFLNRFFFKGNGPNAVVPELPAESLDFAIFTKNLEFWIKKLNKKLKKKMKVRNRIDMTTVSEPGDVTPSVKRICIFKLEDGAAVSFEKSHDEFICQYADCSTENDPTTNVSILKDRILGKIRSGRIREYHDYVFADCLYPAEKRKIIKVCRGATRVLIA